MVSTRITRLVQTLNLDNVDSLPEAQSRQWKTLGHLTDSISSASIQYFSNHLYIVGYYSGRNLQVFDLKSNTTEKFSNVYSTSFAAGVDYAGSWISNGNMSIFGGENSEPCYQQSGPLDDPGVYWGDSCDNSIIEGTVIKGGGQWVGYANVFK